MIEWSHKMDNTDVIAELRRVIEDKNAVIDELRRMLSERVSYPTYPTYPTYPQYPSYPWSNPIIYSSGGCTHE